MTRYRDYAIARTSNAPFLHRALILVLLVAGVTLLVLGKSQNTMVTHLRSQMLSMLEPALSAVSRPVTAIREFTDDSHAFFNTFDENKKLRAENDALNHWRSVALALQAENDALRKL